MTKSFIERAVGEFRDRYGEYDIDGHCLARKLIMKRYTEWLTQKLLQAYHEGRKAEIEFLIQNMPGVLLQTCLSYLKERFLAQRQKVKRVTK